MKKAMEIALLGDRFSATDAESAGIINRAVTSANLEDETAKLANRLAAGPTAAYGRTKQLLNAALDSSLRNPASARGRAVRRRALSPRTSPRASPPSSGSESRSSPANNDEQDLKGSVTMANLAGKTLFITGASRGIGLAIALRAARDGANVVIAAKTTEPHPKLPGTIHTAAEEIEAAGGKALPLHGRHPRRGRRSHAAVDARRSRRSAASTSWSTTPAPSASPARSRRR